MDEDDKIARRWRGDKGKDYGDPKTMEYQTDPPEPRRRCMTETGEKRDRCYGKREIEFRNPAQYAKEWREMNVRKAVALLRAIEILESE